MAEKSPRRRSTPLQWLAGALVLVLALFVFARLSPPSTAPGLDQPAATPTQADASADAVAQDVRPTPAADSATAEGSASQSGAPATDAQPTPAPLCNTTQVSDLPVIVYADLPPEAHDTIDLIQSGGPFPYDEDGSIFENREGILPTEAQGYYREYTVITPGEPDRGARRIVGGEREEMYYTDDHYASFSEVICP